MFNITGLFNKKRKKESVLNNNDDFCITTIQNLDINNLSENYKYNFPMLLNDYNELTALKGLHIVIYHINKVLSLPFIEYMLFFKNETYNFLKMNYNGDINGLMNEMKNYLVEKCENLKSIKPKGYIQYNSNTFLICEIEFNTQLNVVSHIKHQYEMVCVYEIINIHFVYDKLINELVESFFKNNKSLLFIYKDYDNLKESIPHPYIMYGSDNSIDHFYHLKRGRKEEDGIVNKGYYFTTYSNCILNKKENHIIYKYVIQPNKIKFVFNKFDLNLYKDNWSDTNESIFINLHNTTLVIKTNKNHFVNGYFG